MTSINSEALTSTLMTLSNCLAQTNDNYQRLLSEPDDSSLCKQVGCTVRSLSKSCAAVLIAVVENELSDDGFDGLDDLDDLELLDDETEEEAIDQ